ncbi:MAG: nitrile hydratase subunit beta [Rhodobacteraceae bacterium]|nr:nitrile hydratase subunit beta [Paracoccaceae bacterium]
MTRVHDMGGRYGDGPVASDPNTPLIETEWHGRALALTLAAGALGEWNIDMSRHARESLPAKDYTRFSYYEKWLAALANLLVARSLVTPAEIAGGMAETALPHPRRLPPEAVAETFARHVPYARKGRAGQFTPGDRVRTRLPARNAAVDGGHTRLPAYLAGHTGRIVLSHGAHVFPDMNAHGLGEAPEPLYTVAFAAADLWGHAEHPGDEVTADLWQSYLEPA